MRAATSRSPMRRREPTRSPSPRYRCCDKITGASGHHRRQSGTTVREGASVRAKTLGITLGIVALLGVTSWAGAASLAAAQRPEEQHRTVQRYGHLPLSFIENQ